MAAPPAAQFAYCSGQPQLSASLLCHFSESVIHWTVSMPAGESINGLAVFGSNNIW